MNQVCPVVVKRWGFPPQRNTVLRRPYLRFNKKLESESWAEKFRLVFRPFFVRCSFVVRSFFAIFAFAAAGAHGGCGRGLRQGPRRGGRKN